MTTDRLADLEIPPCRNRQLGHMHRICARCGRCEPGRRRVGDEQWCATCWGDANEAGLV